MKRILVTGASRGLGLAVAAALLGQGHEVVAVARSESSALEGLGREHPGRLHFHSCDLGDMDSLKTFVKSARLLDGVDAFVANAAIGAEGLLTLMSDAAVEECLRVNLRANILLAREVIKGMLPKGGSLVFVSSVAARTGLSGLTVYGATKAGLLALSKGIAREYGTRGIRSNCVLPGFLETEMSAGLDLAGKESVRRRTALKRLGAPDDVVSAILFLISDESRYTTGAELVIDGGMTA